MNLHCRICHRSSLGIGRCSCDRLGRAIDGGRGGGGPRVVCLCPLVPQPQHLQGPGQAEGEEEQLALCDRTRGTTLIDMSYRGYRCRYKMSHDVCGTRIMNTVCRGRKLRCRCVRINTSHHQRTYKSATASRCCVSAAAALHGTTLRGHLAVPPVATLGLHSGNVVCQPADAASSVPVWAPPASTAVLNQAHHTPALPVGTITTV